MARPLPEASARQLAEIGKALADPTRVQMLHMFKSASAPICVCDFTAAFGLSQPTVSHHLSRLRRAGLVSSARRGIWTFHRLVNPLPAAAQAVLDLIP
ncbi:MAG: ArsR/SmtB family transcription factor [Candidatus Dormibacteria bacterium]